MKIPVDLDPNPPLEEFRPRTPPPLEEFLDPPLKGYFIKTIPMLLLFCFIFIFFWAYDIKIVWSAKNETRLWFKDICQRYVTYSNFYRPL